MFIRLMPILKKGIHVQRKRFWKYIQMLITATQSNKICGVLIIFALYVFFKNYPQLRNFNFSMKK